MLDQTTVLSHIYEILHHEVKLQSSTAHPSGPQYNSKY
jgi:hypothetical protein